jgi:hypothetical protein
VYGSAMKVDNFEQIIFSASQVGEIDAASSHIRHGVE